jgi:hypothetical protein
VISTVAWFVASLFLLVGPGFARWGNHATPRVLGLPWSHAWVWGIVIANFAVLVVLHTTRWLDDALDGAADGDDSPEEDDVATREAGHTEPIGHLQHVRDPEHAAPSSGARPAQEAAPR